MAFKDITEGKKVAKPLGIQMVSNKEGDKDAFEILFQFEEPSTGDIEKLSTKLWLSDDALPYSMDKLVNLLGYRQDIAETKGLGRDTGVLNFENEVELVVEFKERDGKTRPEIKYINRIGGSMFAGHSAEVTKTKLTDPRIKAAFDAAKQQGGKKEPAADDEPKTVKNHAPGAEKPAGKKKLPW